MPTTKREEVYFGLMMCLGMVLGMTFYNLFTNGLIGTITLKEIIFQLILVFVIASLLELFVVGPVAKKMAFSLPYDKSKKLWVIVSLAFFMVSGMVLCMSLYGLGNAYFSNGLNGASLLGSYLRIVARNFIFALPLQLILVGPIVRYLFAVFIKNRRVNESFS
ncbi:hypothetical protein [Paenibacillus sp. P36]|uniref:hypothetical protein n=1 Tax=Paenibacillus sp. P36 TaxID=3342538 RepID=UPI0038B252C5